MKRNDERETMNDEARNEEMASSIPRSNGLFHSAFIVPRSSFLFIVPRSSFIMAVHVEENTGNVVARGTEACAAVGRVAGRTAFHGNGGRGRRR
jgi:hypothetical protein